MNVESRVLNELSEERYSSGEVISRKLHITRSAVWKHIVKLRARGYRIEASPRRGYRLSSRPDKLLPAEIKPLLNTGIIGSCIFHEDVTGSTIEVARRLIDKGATEGTTVIAEEQTAARGRLGRLWETPAGQAIAMSVILYPPFAPAQAPLLSLATGLAAARAVESVCGVRPQLKWPNDIYLGGRKIGGILVEMAAELDRVRWVIDSIGINVNNMFRKASLAARATSLKEQLGRKVSRLELTAALISELDTMYRRAREEGFAATAAEFEQLDMLQGHEIEVSIPGGGGQVTGKAVGIDNNGRLLVDPGGNDVQALFSGEATLSS